MTDPLPPEKCWDRWTDRTGHHRCFEWRPNGGAPHRCRCGAELPAVPLPEGNTDG